MLSIQLPPSFKRKVNRGKGLSSFLCFCFVCLFVFNSYFEKGCRKKCTRQSRKVLWVVLSSLLFQKNLKEWQERPWTYVYECLIMESNKSRFDSYSRQEECIYHIPYYLSGLSRARFPDNLSRNSCIPKPQILSNRGG